ncbi:hypothetical protein CKALI_09435 [Corynebacterium kalinowskii]|uniref:Uncharacterized protein n=1 Tax=Corynebacterium kalinowskii TaxID=2675216 RepID=A0A6B8VC54_9CORY|nr:hypothetical protein [Corynebacterium kalinowskii]QGU02742.1 hypothetical protein CKALI_09435 [Corynebacterium kalinowskii]
MDVNGGRFYARPLRDDDAIAVAEAVGTSVASISQAREDWETDTAYSWAVCEQTNVNAVAIARYDMNTLEVVPVGDPERDLPNDPMLEPKKAKDGVAAGQEFIQRWIDGYLPSYREQTS